MAEDLFADIPSEAGADLFADIPVPKGRPGVRAALRDIQRLQTMGGRVKARGYGFSDAAAESMLLGLPTQLNAGVGALATGLQRAVPGGKNPKYTAQDMYDAMRLYESARRATYAKKHPGLSTTAQIIGGFAMPGGPAVGEFVTGSKAASLTARGAKIPASVRLGQGLRLSGTAAAQQGVYEAATARPGEEAESAKRGALIGALAAPALGLAASKVATAADIAVRAAKRFKNPLTAMDAAAAKLATALRKAQLDPAAVEAAMAEWRRTGGVTPTLLDILHEAGASSSVYKLLAKSPATAETIQLAEKYAGETVGATQRRAVEQAQRLPTAETRTPSQIREELAAQRAAIETKGAKTRTAAERRGTVKARTVEERGQKKVAEIEERGQKNVAEIEGRDTTPVLEPLPQGAPRNTGAEQFVRELNNTRDTMQAASDKAFEELNALPPEAAVVAPDAVEATIAALRAGMGPNPNLTLEGMQALKGIIDAVEKEAQAGPLTVKRLLDLREKLNEVMDKHRGASIASRAFGVKKQIDATLDGLLERNEIVGDPAVIEKVREANSLYSNLMDAFGSGLPAKLTERKPGKPFETVIDPARAGDEIFTAENVTPRVFDKIGQEMGRAMEMVSPEAQAALKAEALARTKPEVLPELLKSPYADVLLPREMAETSITAQATNAERMAAAQAAEEAKAAEIESAKAAKAADIEAAKAATEERKALVENTTAARTAAAEKAQARELAPVEATEGALATGEKVLTDTSEKFTPPTGEGLPVAQSGARQAVVDFLESQNPQSTARIKTLSSERALANLSAIYGPEEAARFQERLRQIAGQGQRARELASAAKSDQSFGSLALEDIKPQNVAYLSGRTELALEALRGMGRLTPEQQAAALKLLTEEGDLGLMRLMPKLRRRYIGVGPRTGAAMVRPLAPEGEDLETMKLSYGIE